MQSINNDLDHFYLFLIYFYYFLAKRPKQRDFSFADSKKKFHCLLLCNWPFVLI